MARTCLARLIPSIEKPTNNSRIINKAMGCNRLCKWSIFNTELPLAVDQGCLPVYPVSPVTSPEHIPVACVLWSKARL